MEGDDAATFTVPPLGAIHLVSSNFGRAIDATYEELLFGLIGIGRVIKDTFEASGSNIIQIIGFSVLPGSERS